MRWKGWERIELEIGDPESLQGRHHVSAIAPLIISASRSTDIPAFYGEWFARRLAAGYVTWKSPFGGRPVYVSFAKARLFAFWSKNPAPFLPVLDTLDREGYGYFFLFTLNDYENEGLEPGLPSLSERITMFRHLAGRLGPGRVIWRFDPLLLSETVSVCDLLDRLQCVGDALHPYLKRLVISFIDIAKYPRVQRNLSAAGCQGVREFSDNEVTELAEGLSALNERWKASITSCGERRDLSKYGIGREGCISADLISSEFYKDRVLMEFLGIPQQVTPDGTGRRKIPPRSLKDPGQRSTCSCIVSKDIGQYSTCPHGCVYCYANASSKVIRRNRTAYLDSAARGIFNESITE